MSNLGKMVRIAGLVGGLCLLASQSTAAEGSKVIRDREWTIKIRSKNRNEQPSRVTDESRTRNVNVTPAVFQQPEAVQAPAPETVKPAPEPAPVDPKTEKSNPAGPKLNPATNSDAVGSPLELVPAVMSPSIMTYEQAYAAVPFSRTEYEANPTYRHQAALELMFRTLRPTTIVQNYTPRAFRYPDSYQLPYGRSDTQHINIRTFGDGPNYNGQSPFGYPYGLKGNW